MKLYQQIVCMIDLLASKWTGGSLKISLIGKIEGRLSELPRVKEHLKESTDKIEKGFLEVVEAFDLMTAKGRKMEDGGAELMELISGQGDGQSVIETALDILNENVSKVKENSQYNYEVIRQLKNFNLKIEHLLKKESTINETITPFRFIRTLFRVEAATIPAEHRAVFESLADDMGKLVDDVSRIFSNQFENLRFTHQKIAATVAQLTEQIEMHEKIVSAKQRLTDDSMGKLHETIDLNREKNTHLLDLTKQISRIIGKLIISLQFHDITNQKLEHINKGLDEMTQTYLDLKQSPSIGKLLQTFGMIHASTKLQFAQTQAVQRDVSSAEETILQEMGNLAKVNKEFLDEALKVNDFQSHTSSVDGIIQVLLDEIHAISDLINNNLSINQQTLKTIEPIKGTTSNLTETMTNITINIRFIALNSQIYAAHIGEGTGLGELSAQTQHISDSTLEISSELAEELRTLEKGFDDILDQLRAYNHSSTQQSDIINTSGKETIKNLHQMRDRSMNVMLQLGEVSDHIEKEMHSLKDKIKFQEHLSQPLAIIRENLHSIIEFSSKVASAGAMKTMTQKELEKFKSNYTMQSERDVHITTQEISNVKSFEDFGTASGRISTDLFADRDSSVDLFDSPPPGAEHDDPSLDADFELFDDPPSTATKKKSPESTHHSAKSPPVEPPKVKPEPAPKNNDNLGDNIELF